MGGHRASGAGDDAVDGPVDLAAVRADDALLDAIAGTGPAAARPGLHGAGYGFTDSDVDDDRIAAVLAAWKAEIEAEPMPELVTLDEAVEAVTAGHEARNRVASRTRRRMPFAIAAAAAVVAFSGLTVAIHGSAPGDTLWGVDKVLFSEHAAQVQKVEDVRQHIEDANAAIDRQDYPAARQALKQADIVLPAIPPQEQAPLTAERDKVESSLTPSPSTTAPGVPSGPGDRTSPRRGNPVPDPAATATPPTSTTAPLPDSSTGTTPVTPPDGTKGRSATPPSPTTTTPTSGLTSPSTSTTG